MGPVTTTSRQRPTSRDDGRDRRDTLRSPSPLTGGGTTCATTPADPNPHNKLKGARPSDHGSECADSGQIDFLIDTARLRTIGVSVEGSETVSLPVSFGLGLAVSYRGIIEVTGVLFFAVGVAVLNPTGACTWRTRRFCSYPTFSASIAKIRE
jgi:hypothetical protein